MRRLTEKQAFDAMRLWLIRHAPFDWDVHDLVFASDYVSLWPDGSPLTSDPGEWSEWTKCVTEILSETADSDADLPTH